MGSDRAHRHNRAATASQLDVQIAAVRRELACVLNEYRELGMRVSALRNERNIARQNLSRTEQYLQWVRPELVPSARQERSAPETAAISDAEIPAAPQPSPPVEPAYYWRRAANRIAVQTLPARRLRHELETLQRQLADSRQDCRRLERRAARLRVERDGALADLERAGGRSVAARTATR